MEDIDPDFEPQSRPRSCTWPLRRPDFLEKPAAGATAAAADQGTVAAQPVDQSQENISPQVPETTADVKQELSAAGTRKNCSRRNAWGNLSYADLITKAISSAPDQRLTLSQIYDWMVKNVPFFKDKGDSNSSAGWKNSIRHNLSLHSRFMRVQNEGTGKSSWWMLNPDAKPGKSSRRRASSMDTTNPKWEKKRGRAKKKVLEEQQKWSRSPTPIKLEPGDVDQSPLAFALSSEFRSRASSNASSCGRLSPILANPHAEINDMHDNEVPPMSPIPYADMPSSQAYDSPDHVQTDQLTTLAQAMTLNTSMNGVVKTEQMNSPVEQLRVPTPHRQGGHQPPSTLFQNQTNNTTSNGYMFTPPPSNYSNCSSDLSPAHSGVQSPYNPYGHNQSMSPISQQRCSPGMTVTDMSSYNIGMQPQQPSHPQQQQGTFTGLLSSPDVSYTQSNVILNQQADPMLAHSPMQQDQQGLIMRQQHSPQIMPNCRADKLNMSPNGHPRSPAYQVHIPTTLSTLLNNPMTSTTQSNRNPSPHQPPNFQSQQMHSSPNHMPHNNGHHTIGVPEKFPSDLDNLDLDMFTGIDCDMETIIKNELDMGDGNLDFNFDNPSVNAKANVAPSWVH